MLLLHRVKWCISKINSYRISTYAASASFFLISSLLPSIMLVLSILSWVGLDFDTELMGAISRILPDALEDVFYYVVQNLRDIGAAEFSISVVALLWTASKSMIGIVDGLNNIAGDDRVRSYILKRLVCLFYMVVLMAGLLLTLGLRVFGHSILELLQRHLPYVGKVFSMVMEFRGITLYLIITIIITFVYAVFPNKRMSFFRQLPGAALASAAWLGFSAVYSVYVQYVSTASVIYGGLGVVVLAMLWVYFCMYILFIGAVINRIFPNLMTSAIKAVKTIPARLRKTSESQEEE